MSIIRIKKWFYKVLFLYALSSAKFCRSFPFSFLLFPLIKIKKLVYFVLKSIFEAEIGGNKVYSALSMIGNFFTLISIRGEKRKEEDKGNVEEIML